MKHQYQHKENGELVTVLTVDLLGADEKREWIIHLSNGTSMPMHDFVIDFDAVPDLLWNSLPSDRSDNV